MTTEQALHSRSDSKCELCGAVDNLGVYLVPPEPDDSPDTSILVCEICRSQIDDPHAVDMNHWRCLSDSMWSQVPAVQVMAWRRLQSLSSETWAQELLDMLYLDELTLAWAEAVVMDNGDAAVSQHFDANGVRLQSGDTVILSKDLNVKGAGFTAKRGTAVRGISLVSDNPLHIEGRVNGQQIVILTEFVKKS